MLVVISDLHLRDGTCANTLGASVFRLFTARLQELAYNASWRTDGRYDPLKEINILWLGDVLDPLYSTNWLDTEYGTEEYIRPWTDQSDPRYAQKLREITKKILKYNRHVVDAIYNITRDGAIQLPPAIGLGQPDPTAKKKIIVKVNIYYMLGNHDWVYHLKGEAFDEIRQEIVDAFGLACSNAPFPHDVEESPELEKILSAYRVYARHGDIYDSFNYNKKRGRDFSTLGDLFTVEMVNRFSYELKRQLKDELPRKVHESFFEMANIRPALTTPLWVSSQIMRNNLPVAMQHQMKNILNQVCTSYLQTQRAIFPAKPFRLGFQTGLWLILTLTKSIPVAMNAKLTLLAFRLFGKRDAYTLADRAMQEKAFLEKKADYIIYGHTHDNELIPLHQETIEQNSSQIYFNSGTWNTYYSLARYQPEAQRFIPYQVMTYLAFYKDDEREGLRFETWSGTSL